MAGKTGATLQEKFSEISQKNPYAIIGGVLILLIIMDYFFVLQFQLKTLNSLSPQQDILSREVQTTRENLQRLPQNQKELDSLKARLEQMNVKMHTKEEVQIIQETVSRIARETGVEIGKIIPRTSIAEPILENENGKYFEVPIQLEARCGYHNLGQFINKLENEVIFLKFPQFSLTAQQDNPRKHLLEMTLNIIVLEKGH